MSIKHRRGPIWGLLAMFGAAVADGTLPKYSFHCPKRPGHISEWMKQRAKAKRLRRAASPYASNYAKSNAR